MRPGVAARLLRHRAHVVRQLSLHVHRLHLWTHRGAHRVAVSRPVRGPNAAAHNLDPDRGTHRAADHVGAYLVADLHAVCGANAVAVHDPDRGSHHPALNVANQM